MNRFLVSILVMAILFCASAEAGLIIVDFEELSGFTGTNPAGGGQFFNGNDGTGTTNSDGWTSNGVFFNNDYNGDFLPTFDFWSGWAYSDVQDSNTPFFTNQYAAFPGGGADGFGGVQAGGVYAVAFGQDAFFNLPANSLLHSVELTNTTYAALSIRDGSGFSDPFGVGDFFRVRLQGFDGLDATGTQIGSVLVSLADFTNSDSSNHSILNHWMTVDLSPIASARSVSLLFESSDEGPFGINTPLYVAMDNLQLSTVVPEPSSFILGLGFALAMLCRLRRGGWKASAGSAGSDAGFGIECPMR